MLKAMAKSYLPPCLGMSAGAKLTVMRRSGNSRPELIMALLTLSLLSFTAFSGKPTMAKLGSPLDKWVSTFTSTASTPSNALEFIVANDMGGSPD